MIAVRRSLAGGLVGLALMLAYGSAAEAQAPADDRITLATELASLTVASGDSGPLITRTIDGMWTALAVALPPGTDASVQDELHAHLVGGLTPVYRAMIASVRDSLMPDLARELADALTTDELRAGIAFYGSPAGRRFVNAAPDVNLFVLETLFDPAGTDAVAFAAANEALRARGLAELPLPDAATATTTATEPPAMTATAINARLLLPYSRDMMDEVAYERAFDFVDAFVEAHAAELPGDPVLLAEVTDALDVAMTGFYSARGARLLDEMAIQYAEALMPDGVAAAVAFMTAPETNNLRYLLELVGLQHTERTRAAIAAAMPAMMVQIAPVLAGFNAILVRHGLPAMRM